MRAAAVEAPPSTRPEAAPVEEAAPSDASVPAGHVEIPFEAPPPLEGAGVDDDDDGDELEPLDVDDDAPPSTPGHAPELLEDAQVCGDPDCPACSGMGAAKRCSATGKLVWRPLRDKAAAKLGRGMLGVIGFGVMLARSDRQFVRANDEEIAEMGAALKDVTYRRFNGIGAISDIIELGTSMIDYGVRAVAAPKLPPGGTST